MTSSSCSEGLAGDSSELAAPFGASKSYHHCSLTRTCQLPPSKNCFRCLFLDHREEHFKQPGSKDSHLKFDYFLPYCRNFRICNRYPKFHINVTGSQQSGSDAVHLLPSGFNSLHVLQRNY